MKKLKLELLYWLLENDKTEWLQCVEEGETEVYGFPNIQNPTPIFTKDASKAMHFRSASEAYGYSLLHHLSLTATEHLDVVQ